MANGAIDDGKVGRWDKRSARDDTHPNKVLAQGNCPKAESSSTSPASIQSLMNGSQRSVQSTAQPRVSIASASMCPRQTPKIMPPLKRLQPTRGAAMKAREPDSFEEKGRRQPRKEIVVSVARDTPGPECYGLSAVK
jgi:hypothetical protein